MNDSLLNKSQFNTDAAELLYKNNLYSSACHPIYYSCLQLISYKLMKCGVTLEQQASLSSSRYHGNSHQCLIKESRERINTKNYREKKEYEDNLKQLKELREKADYKEEAVSQTECASGMEIAKLVRQKINTIN